MGLVFPIKPKQTETKPDRFRFFCGESEYTKYEGFSSGSRKKAERKRNWNWRSCVMRKDF